MKPLVYMAAPVRPVGDETIAGNLERAAEWLRWFIFIMGKHWLVVAPWIGELHGASHLEADENQRAVSLLRCQDMASRCAVIILCGERYSDGMRLEAGACVRAGGSIVNVIGMTREQILRNWQQHPPETSW